MKNSLSKVAFVPFWDKNHPLLVLVWKIFDFVKIKSSKISILKSLQSSLRVVFLDERDRNYVKHLLVFVSINLFLIYTILRVI